MIAVGPGVPLGIEHVTNASLGLGGAYGTWGECLDNSALPGIVEHILGHPLDSGPLNVGDFGFFYRHHVPDLSHAEHEEVELQAGTRFIIEACHAAGWEPGEVDAVLIGITTPVVPDYVEQIAARAGIPERSLKVSVHKACDGSVAALNLALNPALPGSLLHHNLAQELQGKKVLVGGIEGLSRVMHETQDPQALQLFGNGAGIFGLIPGETMRFIAGESQEVYDTEGLLQVRMTYPHSAVLAARDPGDGRALAAVCGPAARTGGGRRAGGDGRADGHGQALRAERRGRGPVGVRPTATGWLAWGCPGRTSPSRSFTTRT